MFRMLTADFKKITRNKKLLVLLPGAVIGYSLFECVLMAVMAKFLLKEPAGSADMLLSSFASLSAIYVSAILSSYFAPDFTEGTIRNKIITGTKRSSVLLSSCCLAVVITELFQLLFFAATMVFGNIFMDGFVLGIADILKAFGIYCLAGAAISVFFTVLIYLLGNSKSAISLAGPVIAVFFSVFSSIVTERLYPNAKVDGVRLEVYTFFDRYIPFFHLSGFPRWDLGSYLIGNAALLFTSLVFGIIFFERQEMK